MAFCWNVMMNCHNKTVTNVSFKVLQVVKSLNLLLYMIEIIGLIHAFASNDSHCYISVLL